LSARTDPVAVAQRVRVNAGERLSCRAKNNSKTVFGYIMSLSWQMVAFLSACSEPVLARIFIHLFI
jgi:hypothetical protein